MIPQHFILRKDHRSAIASGDGSLETEEARIRAAYAKRDGDDVRYSWFSPGHVFMIQEREREILALLKRSGFTALHTKKILEVGCGAGYWLRELVKWGAKPENLVGVDLLPGSVAQAKNLCPSGINLHCNSATKLAFDDETFDLVLQSTVFTSILNADMKQRIACEMIRVLKKDGIIIWYDYHINNPRNREVRGVKKREIRKLFSDCRISLRRVTLAPPLVRFLTRYSWLGVYLLSKTRLLCTHYIGVIQKSD